MLRLLVAWLYLDGKVLIKITSSVRLLLYSYFIYVKYASAYTLVEIFYELCDFTNL